MAVDEKMDPAKPKRTPWWIWAIALFMICGGFVAGIPELRSTFADFIVGTFQLIFTPFILESTLMIGGFFLVIVVVAFLRMREDKDEWVYLSQVDPETVDKSLPEPLQKRIESAAFKGDQAIVEDPEDVTAETIEGYIRLGMFDEATEELIALSESPDDQQTARRLQWLLTYRAKGEAEAAKLGEGWLRDGLVQKAELEEWAKEV